MATIFESLMREYRSMRTTSRSPKTESCKKIPYKHIKLESRRVFEEEDFDELDKQFSVDPESEEGEDEVVLVIDPELPSDEEVPEDAAEKMVGDLVYKCPVCGGNYVCSCDPSKNEALEVDEEGVPTECPICGDDTEQILVGEIAPAEGAGEETEMDPVDGEDSDEVEETSEDEVVSDEEEETFEEESVKKESATGRKPLKSFRKKSESLKESASSDRLLVKYAGSSKKDSKVYPWSGTGTPSLDLKLDDESVSKVSDRLERDGFNLVDQYDGSYDEDSYLVYTKVSGKDKILAVILMYDGGATLQITVNPEDEESLEYFDESCSSKKEEDLKSESLKEGDEFCDDGSCEDDALEPLDPVEEVVEDDSEPQVKIDAKVVNLSLDDKKFESLMNQVIKENYKNSSSFKITKVSCKGSSLKIEYVVRRRGGKSLRGTMIGEGFDKKSRKSSISFKDKGVFTESYGTKPSFIVEFVKIRSSLIPMRLNYDYKVKVNESLYRIYGKVGK